MKRAHRQAAPLVVVRSEAESGRVGLRLIGELDLHTVDLLEAELASTREQSPPSVIDLSELRFLDLAGLRVLLRAVASDAAGAARLVGATGIVRRLIDLAHTLDGETDDPARSPFPTEPATRLGGERRQSVRAATGYVAAAGARAEAETPASTMNGDLQ